MPRPIWKGHISFGLVSIPVAVYPAVQREDLDFRMLDRRNLAPVGFQRINKEDGKEVPWEDVVKGYEYEENKYVVLEPEDFRRADVKASETIEILNFVEQSEIDPVYFEQPYYLTPAKNGEKGYALLREALRRSGRVAVAYVVLSNRQHVAALIPKGDLLILDLLRFGYELRDASAIGAGGQSAEIREKELKMAQQLIEGMVEPWTPEKYHDQYRDELLAMIHRKVETGQTEAIGEPAAESGGGQQAQVIDMLSLLKASIAQTEKQARGKSAAGRKKSTPRSAPAQGRRGTAKSVKTRKSA